MVCTSRLLMCVLLVMAMGVSTVFAGDSTGITDDYTYRGKIVLPAVFIWACSNLDSNTWNDCPQGSPDNLYGANDRWHAQHTWIQIHNPTDYTLPMHSIKVSLYDDAGNLITKNDIIDPYCWLGTTINYMDPLYNRVLEPKGSVCFYLDACLVDHHADESLVASAIIEFEATIAGPLKKINLYVHAGWEMSKEAQKPGTTTQWENWCNAGTLIDKELVTLTAY
ncbi:hypothetical protein JXA80_06545 [bacterium]|nr:hypothetical protein [candidate division CSSED10-310 bacterium]